MVSLSLISLDNDTTGVNSNNCEYSVKGVGGKAEYRVSACLSEEGKGLL